MSEALINSYWDAEGYAEAYNRTASSEGLKAVADVLDRAPRVETFHISSPTYHQITARRREAYRDSRSGRG